MARPDPFRISFMDFQSSLISLGLLVNAPGSSFLLLLAKAFDLLLTTKSCLKASMTDVSS